MTSNDIKQTELFKDLYQEYIDNGYTDQKAEELAIQEIQCILMEDYKLVD